MMSETDPRPDLTVVIPTFDRVDQCLVAVESVRRIGIDNQLAIQTIVIEQGPQQTYPLPSDFDGIWLYTTHCSTSHARNAGLDRASADTVIFLDDDGELLSGAVEIVDRHRVAGNAVTMGRVEWIGGAPADSSNPATAVTAGNLFKYFLECGTVWDVAALRAIDGFDERFGPPNDIGAEEGAEAIGRLATHVDMPHRYEPVDMVRHPSLQRLALFKAARYGRGAGALLPLSPSRWVLRYWATIGARRTVGMFAALATRDLEMFRMRRRWLFGFASGVVHGLRQRKMPARRTADMTVVVSPTD
jgi:Glycosyl transferase family 2